jgi:hypothetical protein
LEIQRRDRANDSIYGRKGDPKHSPYSGALSAPSRIHAIVLWFGRISRTVPADVERRSEDVIVWNTSACFSLRKSPPKSDMPSGSPVLDPADYLLPLADTDRMPARSSIDPSLIDPTLLPWIFMVDVLEDKEILDYRYRLAGTSNVQLVGREPTGKLASDIFGDKDRAFMMETFHVTVHEKQPTFWHGAVPHEKYGSIGVVRGIFPLSNDGENVDILIGAAVPERWPLEN